MVTFRRILVPIDFSDPSKDALAFATSFAQGYDAELTLVYVAEPVMYPADFGYGQVAVPDLELEMQTKGEEHLRKLAEESIGSMVQWNTVIRTGKPFVEINLTAREISADLIIIATHGHTGIDHVLFGSTAEKVVRKAPCPVLTLRPRAPSA